MKRSTVILATLLFLVGCAQKALQNETISQSNVTNTPTSTATEAVTTEKIAEKPTIKKTYVPRRSKASVKTTAGKSSEKIPENLMAAPQPALEPAPMQPQSQSEALIQRDPASAMPVVEPQEAGAGVESIFSQYGLYLLAGACLSVLLLILGNRDRLKG
jgi:hypothetical protein